MKRDNATIENQGMVTKIREKGSWTTPKKNNHLLWSSPHYVWTISWRTEVFPLSPMYMLLLLTYMLVRSMGLECWDFKVPLWISDFQPGRTPHTGWGKGRRQQNIVGKSFWSHLKKYMYLIIDLMTSTCLSNKNQSLIVIIETTQGKEDNIILANGNGLKKKYFAYLH